MYNGSTKYSKEKKKMKRSTNSPSPKKLPSLIVRIGMPLITLVFIYILHTVINTPENEKAWLYTQVYTMLEYAVMSFTLIFCAPFFTDMALKDI